MVDHLLRHNQLARRAKWLLDRALRGGSIRKLKAARSEFDHVVAVMSPDHPDRPACLNNLGLVCRLLYERTAEIAAIDDLVRVNELIVTSLPESHPDRVAHRQNLCLLVARIVVDSPPAGLRSRIVPLAREAAFDTTSRPVFLWALAACLGESARLTGDLNHAAEIVEVDRERIAEASADDPDTGAVLGDLGASLLQLALVSDQPALLTEAIQVGRQAVERCPPRHDRYPACLSSLGNSLNAQFIMGTGVLESLWESVELGRRAVAAAASEHPDRPSVLSNLGIALRTCYEHTRDLDTLREAVSVSREAVESTTSDDLGRALRLSNLSAADQELFKRSGHGPSIAEAVTAALAAVDLTPAGTPLWAERMTELGNALHILGTGYSFVADDPADGDVKLAHEAPGDMPSTPEALDRTRVLLEAVEVCRAAAAAAVATQRGSLLNNLSIAARTYFEHIGDTAALAEAVQAGRDSVAALRAGTVDREGALLSLVRSLALLHTPDVLPEMRRCCDELRTATVPRIGVLAHWLLGQATMTAGRPNLELALAAYEQAIARLPQIAPRRLLRADREHGLRELAGLPAEAAAAALALGRPEHALLLLEHARGLLLRESYSSRSSLAELARVAPETAEELVRLHEMLDMADRDSVDLYHDGIPIPHPTGSRAEQHRELAEQWDNLLVRVRRLPGLERFLLPPTIESLRGGRSTGPTVLINPSPYRCDALLSASNAPVRAIELNCDYADLLERAANFQASSPSAAGPAKPDERRMIDDLAWIWRHIAEPVLAALGLLSAVPRTPDEAPRIWWCPIGIAAFLPLHAAGHYDEATTEPSSVMDHVVSSYTATVANLGLARRAAAPPASNPSGLVVVEMSRTPGARPLPGARAEARRLAELAPDLTRLADAQATRAAVLAALPAHRIAHFACHAVTDARSPTLNRLLLHDHSSAPLTAIEMAALHLPDAELAYLSACETAVSSWALADEAVHIAAAFQLAGYRHVVATLWPIADSAAGRIADDFYTALAPTLCTDATARALHRAVCGLRRDAPDKPSRWAAHLHFGD